MLSIEWITSAYDAFHESKKADVLPPTLTVHEALLFAACLRLPEHVSHASKLARVDEVMEQLGLSSLAHTRIGNQGHRGLSGGEMRRVSIGLEIVGKPDILILDEPVGSYDHVILNALTVFSIILRFIQRRRRDLTQQVHTK